MERKLDHLGIVVRSLAESLPLYTDVIGLAVEGTEVVESERVRVAMLPAGGTRVELLEPLDSESAAGRFLERRGGGLHHICFQVPDIEAACRRCRDAGVDLIGEGPRAGVGGRPVVFLDPRGAGRVLIELVEIPEASDD